MVLYNPPHAKRVLSPEQIGELKTSVEALVGVKVCDGDEEWYRQMREHCSGLSVFVPGHHLATGIRNGAHGAYSNVACLHPGAAQRWYEQMHTDLEGALELEQRICVFMKQHIVPFIQAGHSNMAVDKLMAAVGGWCPMNPRLRRPYRGVEEEAIEPLREVVQEMLPEFV